MVYCHCVAVNNVLYEVLTYLVVSGVWHNSVFLYEVLTYLVVSGVWHNSVFLYEVLMYLVLSGVWHTGARTCVVFCFLLQSVWHRSWGASRDGRLFYCRLQSWEDKNVRRVSIFFAKFSNHGSDLLDFPRIVNSRFSTVFAHFVIFDPFGIRRFNYWFCSNC